MEIRNFAHQYLAMRNSLILTVLVLALIAGCKSGQKAGDGYGRNVVYDTLPAINVSSTPKRPVYNPSRTREHDLLHTRLDVRFDWAKQHCLGSAELTLTPYFYATNKVVLDAKGFDLHSVQLITDSTSTDLSHTYDSLQIDITLPSTYSREDTFKLGINYTAKPNELEAGGSTAITSDIGLYFINPDSTEDKPQQIWTQGETEANSC